MAESRRQDVLNGTTCRNLRVPFMGMTQQWHRGAAGALISAGTGAALTWLVLSALERGDDFSAAAPALERRAAELREGRIAAADIARDATPAPEVPAITAARSEVGIDAAAPAATERNPIVSDLPPRDLPVTRTELPNRRDGDLSASMPAAALLGSLRITCDFGAGNNTGTRVGDTLTIGGGAQWVGGPLVYDFVNATAGAARLTGSVGATGSPTGEATMQVSTEGSRVMLSGFLANRAFVAVTIFDELDNVGRHIAVMSRHEDRFTYASQFLGTCE